MATKDIYKIIKHKYIIQKFKKIKKKREIFKEIVPNYFPVKEIRGANLKSNIKHGSEETIFSGTHPSSPSTRKPSHLPTSPSLLLFLKGLLDFSFIRQSFDLWYETRRRDRERDAYPWFQEYEIEKDPCDERLFRRRFERSNLVRAFGSKSAISVSFEHPSIGSSCDSCDIFVVFISGSFCCRRATSSSWDEHVWWGWLGNRGASPEEKSGRSHAVLLLLLLPGCFIPFFQEALQRQVCLPRLPSQPHPRYRSHVVGKPLYFTLISPNRTSIEDYSCFLLRQRIWEKGKEMSLGIDVVLKKHILLSYIYIYSLAKE